MVSVDLVHQRLLVRLDGSDAVWAFNRRIEVPLSTVTAVRVVDDLSPYLGWRHGELGLRAPGTMIPNRIAAGSYWRRGWGWTFACVRRRLGRAVVIDIQTDAVRYRRLVLGVADPDAVAARLNDR